MVLIVIVPMVRVPSTLMEREALVSSKLANAPAASGTVPDQFAALDQLPLPAPLHLTPVGGVTCAQFRSMRMSSKLKLAGSAPFCRRKKLWKNGANPGI